MNRYINPDSEKYFAFNIWSIESAKAVMDAAAQTGCGVILQTSMKSFEQLDKEEFQKYVKSYAEKKNVRAYLHLDHCRNMSLIHEAVRCGWDSVMIDGSDKSLEENIRMANETVEAARPKGVLVEAEVGRICGQEDGISSIETGIAEITDIREFIRNADVDMIAAAIGTAHGLYKGAPHIHYDMITAMERITDIPFVIHGGTGLNDETLLKLLSYKNVKKINISTDVKLAYRRGIEESIHTGVMEKRGFDPLRVNRHIHDAIQSMAAHKLEILRKG